MVEIGARNVFLYWVGKDYSLISILRKLIYFHSKTGNGYTVHLITDKNINEYITYVPSYFFSMCPAHQADYVRVNVICTYGGIWLDSDTLVIESLDQLFYLIENKSGFFITQNDDTIWNGIFGSKANTQMMIQWKNEMQKILDIKQGKINWCEIGNDLLGSIYTREKKLYDNYNIISGLNTIYPVNWRDCVEEYIVKPYDNYHKIVRKSQPLIVLVNSVYKELEKRSEIEILHGNMPLNYFINKSIDNAGISKNKFIFDYIYQNNVWNNNDVRVPLSGPGSSLINTKNCSKMINDFINSNSITSVLDLGCGDLHWISKAPFFTENLIRYTGVDIVESLISEHLSKYPDKSFLCKDIVSYRDFANVDMIIIRDVIFHLSNKDIQMIFDNIKGKFKFLVITSCVNLINTDVFDKWNFTKKNIHIAPFNISGKYLTKTYENEFNRNIYIYDERTFYHSD